MELREGTLPVTLVEDKRGSFRVREAVQLAMMVDTPGMQFDPTPTFACKGSPPVNDANFWAPAEKTVQAANWLVRAKNTPALVLGFRNRCVLVGTKPDYVSLARLMTTDGWAGRLSAIGLRIWFLRNTLIYW